jgi:hypothetical protein
MSHGGLLISGALAIQSGRLAVSASTAQFAGVERGSRQLGWLGTLLGPEGTGACHLVLLGQTSIPLNCPGSSVVTDGLGYAAVWVLGLFVF